MNTIDKRLQKLVSKLANPKIKRDKEPNRKEILKALKLFKLKAKMNQTNRCSICREEFNSERRMCVDHCHDTGKLRGLLCTTCNIGLGMFKDNVHLLAEAIEYLERNK